MADQERPDAASRIEAEEERPRRLPGLTVKATVIGAAGIWFQALHMMRSYPRVQGVEFDPVVYYSVFALAYLFVLVVISGLAHQFFNRKLISRQELAVITVMNMIATLAMGSTTHWGFGIFSSLPSLVAIQPEHRPWLEQISSVVFPQDEQVLQLLLTGGDTPWGAWFAPVIWWTVFFGLSYWLMFCIAVMVRRRWAEMEAYQFPLVEPALVLLEESKEGSQFGPIWRTPWAYIGFVIGAAFIVMMDMPHVFPVWEISGEAWFIEFMGEPWGPDWLVGPWSPLVVGLAYIIMNVQILFSVWFFYLGFHYLGILAFDATGILEVGDFSNFYNREQLLGSTVAVAAVTVWAARNELRDVVDCALNRDGAFDDSNEFMPYKIAFWGLIVAFVVKVAMAWAFFGINPLYTLSVLIILLCVGMAFGRARAQAGWFANHGVHYLMLHEVPFRWFGSFAFGGTTWLYGRPVMAPDLNNHTAHSVGYTLDMFRVGNETGVERREMAKATFLGGILSILFVLLAGLVVVHAHGGTESVTRWMDEFHAPWDQSFMEDPDGAQPLWSPLEDMWQVFFIGFSVLMVTALNYLFVTFAWFPFHPLGYMLAWNAMIQWLWFAFFAAWVIKTIVLRYGGTALDRNMRTFFLAAVIGYSVFRGIYNALSYIIPIPGAWYF